MRQLKAVIRLVRPRQWVKNIFVLTALIFSGLVTDPVAVLHAALAFAAFCLAASATYLLNDWRDIEDDRRHPLKCNRPLAAGDLPAWSGPVGALLAAGGALVLGFGALGLGTGATIALYLVLNLGYSLGLKHLVIIDVLIISGGFVLRIVAGAMALDVLPSTWLILCAVTISLFLGFTKRRAEVVLLGDKASEHRRVLAHYSTAFLDQMISIVTAATVVCYALYTVDPRTVVLVGSRLLLLSVPLVLYGIFRYLYLVYHGSSGGDPTRTVFTDIPLLVTGALWGGWCTFVILFGKGIKDFLL
ncbi:MAG TPA: decaprenyl-phosphate phosphoribosyltransferase [Polyangia bacterium]|nr:decaprenyl-phosphate phosphoribosyltransferase [Polyangia bacterium]